MFVRCEECKNHYDDSYQDAECVERRHKEVAPRPVETHVEYVRAARLGMGRKREGRR